MGCLPLGSVAGQLGVPCHFESQAISEHSSLPPGFDPVALPAGGAGPFAAAVRDAGVAPGRIFWDVAGGLWRAGLVLPPGLAALDESIDALLLLVGVDTLESLVGAGAEASVILPATLTLDGERVGGVQSAVAPDGAGWAAGGLTLPLEGPGLAGVAAGAALVPMCRHLQVWLDVLAAQGADAVARAVGHRMHVLDDLQERT